MNKHNMKVLINALLDGDQAVAHKETKKLLEGGEGRERIITDGVEAAMARLDNKCTAEQFNLLEIMLAGRAVTAVIKELYPPADPPLQTKGTVVTGTLEGDVHDLGKNILKGVLTAKRYRVVDCGKDCPVEKMIDVVEKEAAMAVCVSGLITTVIPQVRLLRAAMREHGLGHVILLAGGAALKQASAESLGVDCVADTAFDALHYLESLMEVHNEQH